MRKYILVSVVFISLSLFLSSASAKWGKKKVTKNNTAAKDEGLDDYDPFNLREQMLIGDDVVHLAVLRHVSKKKMPVELQSVKKIVLLPLQLGVDIAKLSPEKQSLYRAALKNVSAELKRQLLLGGRYQIVEKAAVADDQTAFVNGVVWVDYQIELKQWVFKNKVQARSGTKEIIQSIPYKEVSGFLKVSLNISSKNTSTSVSEAALNKAAQSKAVIASAIESKAFKIKIQDKRSYKQSSEDTRDTSSKIVKNLKVDVGLVNSLNLAEWVVSRFVRKISPYPALLSIRVIKPSSSKKKNAAFFSSIKKKDFDAAMRFIQKQSGQDKNYNLGVISELKGDIPQAKVFYQKILAKKSARDLIYFEGLKRLSYYESGLLSPLRKVGGK